MTINTRLGLALFVALSLQVLGWGQLTRDTSVLVIGIGVAGLVLLAGWVLRRLSVPPVLLILVQAVLVLLAAWGGLVWAHGPVGPAALPGLVTQGIAAVQGGVAPLGSAPGATLLILLGSGALALLGDLLGITLEQPAWAVAPVVVAHLVTAIGTATPTSLPEFLVLAAGVILILIAGARLSPRDPAAAKVAAWGVGAAIGVLATVLALLLTPLVPSFETRRSNEPLQMNDPSLDLKRNLVQGSDEVIIRYTPEQPDGVYLKLATLPRLSTAGFELSDVRVASGRIPPPPGNPQGTEHTTAVEVGDFASEWLPVPHVPRTIDAPGDWGFALDTLDVMSLDRQERSSATAGLSYTVTSLDVQPSAEEVAGAGSTQAPNQDLTGSLPAGVPPRVRQLAQQVTADAPTAGAKAQALEAYLLSDRFTYSTDPTTGSGDGLDTIDDFLFESRTGYCEQFAGAMAIMAREVGIPSRMAVGFIPGRAAGDGSYELSARDLHTWPELWFDGLGWVAFEPTPARGEGANDAPSTAEPTPSATPTPAEQSPTAVPAEPSEEPQEEPTPARPADPGWASWVPLLVVVLALVIAGVLLARLAPRWLRARRRERHLAVTGDPRADTLAAWEEVRATVADARLTWPSGSPRFAAERFVPTLGTDEAAVDGLRRLAAAAERALYDRTESFDLGGSWREEVLAISAALGAREESSRGNQAPRRAI